MRIGIGRPSARTIWIAAVPLLALVLGTTYLVRLAAGDSDSGTLPGVSSSTSDPSAESGPPSASGSPPGERAPTAAGSGTARRPPPRPLGEQVKTGGSRLDNSTPSSNTCVTFSNKQFPVPVRVVEITISGGPKFMVVDDTACEGGGGLLPSSVRPCRNATLAPGGADCYVGVGVSRNGPPVSYGADSVDHTGKVQLGLRVTCTTQAAWPCDSLERYTPSPEAPVEASWTDPGRERTISVKGANPVTTSPETSAPASGGPEASDSSTPDGS